MRLKDCLHYEHNLYKKVPAEKKAQRFSAGIIIRILPYLAVAFVSAILFCKAENRKC